MKNLIKKSFDLWVRKRWLKIIAKEVAKRDKLLKEYYRKVYVVGELVKEYNKLYPEALLKVKGGDKLLHQLIEDMAKAFVSEKRSEGE